MDCEIDWSTSKVEHAKLSVDLEPAPDFEFMMEFDRLVDPLEHPARGVGQCSLGPRPRRRERRAARVCP